MEEEKIFFYVKHCISGVARGASGGICPWAKVVRPHQHTL